MHKKYCPSHARIGNSKPFWRHPAGRPRRPLGAGVSPGAPPPPARPAAQRRAGAHGLDRPGCWGHISKGILHAQRDERHLRCAHVANEPMHDGVGLGNPIERGLASTGWGNRWRVGRALQMAEHLLDHLGLGDGGHDPERAALAKGTGAQSQGKHPLQESRPAPVRRGTAGLRLFHPLLAWRRCDRAAQVAVRRQTAPIPHQMDARQRDQRCQLLQQFQRRECDAGRPVRPGRGEGIHEIPMGVLGKAFKRHRTAGRIAEQALQLVPPMGRDLRVGMQRKPVDTGTAGARQRGRSPS